MGNNYKSIADDTLKSVEQGYYYNSNNEKIEIAAFAIMTNDEDMIGSFRKRFQN